MEDKIGVPIILKSITNFDYEVRQTVVKINIQCELAKRNLSKDYTFSNFDKIYWACGLPIAHKYLAILNGINLAFSVGSISYDQAPIFKKSLKRAMKRLIDFHENEALKYKINLNDSEFTEIVDLGEE